MAVRDLSLGDPVRGVAFSVLGRGGCGKATMLRPIAGLALLLHMTLTGYVTFAGVVRWEPGRESVGN